VSLEIHQRERETITILDLKGRIVLGPESSHFREVLTPLCSVHGCRIILNMAEVVYVDSTGLGALVFCASIVRRFSGAVKLLAMTGRTLELLVTTKLETIFESFIEEQDAVNSFFPDRAVKKFDILSFVRDSKEEGGPH
jgi:anti-sigma B factor antagonist